MQVRGIGGHALTFVVCGTGRAARFLCQYHAGIGTSGITSLAWSRGALSDSQTTALPERFSCAVLSSSAFR